MKKIINPRDLRQKCQAPECARWAEWYPVVLIYPPENNGDPAQVIIKVAICPQHRNMRATMRTYIKPNGWAQIVRNFIAQGYAIPDERRTKVAFVRIEDANIDATAQFANKQQIKSAE